mgnify:CR=1 FL=1
MRESGSSVDFAYLDQLHETKNSKAAAVVSKTSAGRRASSSPKKANGRQGYTQKISTLVN